MDHAAQSVLEKCLLITEWIKLAEKTLGNSGKVDQKSGRGRPPKSITRAALTLSLPRRSGDAKRKFVERAFKVGNDLFPGVIAAIRDAGLDNKQNALLAIAGKTTIAEQEEEIKAQAARRQSTLTREEKDALAVFVDGWDKIGALRRQDWEAASRNVRTSFARAVLHKGTGS